MVSAEVRRSRSRRIERHARRAPGQALSTGHVGGVPHPGPTAAAKPLVYRTTAGGAVCHARCGQPLGFQGRRGELELDFYCHRCMEHVTVPECVVPLIPVVDDRFQGVTVGAPA